MTNPRPREGIDARKNDVSEHTSFPSSRNCTTQRIHRTTMFSTSIQNDQERSSRILTCSRFIGDPSTRLILWLSKSSSASFRYLSSKHETTADSLIAFG